MRISLTVLTEQGPRDVVVNGDSNMTVETVARSLNSALNADREVLRLRGPALWSAGRALDPAAPVVRLLRDGALVTTDRHRAPATVLAEPRGIAEVRVCGGPAAGAVHRLGLGETTLGTAADVDVHLADPTVPPRALRITVTSRGVTVGGRATLDGTPLDGVTRWPYGGVLVVGTTVLTLAAYAAPDAYLSSLPDGGLVYDRPPRTQPAGTPARTPGGANTAGPGRHRIGAPPEPETYRRRWLLVSALFAVAAIALVLFTGRWYWGVLALAYPAFQAGEWAGDRSPRRAARQRRAGHEATLAAMLRAEEAERRALAPDPAEVLLTATGPRRRLWERRASDPDALHLRFGLVDRPARVEPPPDDERPRRPDPAEPGLDHVGEEAPANPPEPEQPQHLVRAVPVTLPLPEFGVIGLSGPRERSRGLARWLVAQAAVLHSPRDLTVVVLCADPGGGEHWNWVRWLPHCAPRDGEDCVALVGTDPATVAQRVTELAIRITERRRMGHRPASAGREDTRGGPAPAAGGDGAEMTLPDILLVMDGARQLRRVPGMAQVLSGGPGVGLRAICVDDDERLLPEECAAVAIWDWDRPTHVRLRGPGLDASGPVLADQVSPAWCDRTARALAPVRDGAPIPREARLLDILGMPTAARIADAWARRQPGGATETRVPVGVSTGGVYHVDLRSHVLIAGTPGSGKSELLRTLVAALAVANRPDETAFVLIGRFRDCASLPHVVGAVPELDSRALGSLHAELRRREELLRGAGVTDIEDYRELFGGGDPRAPERLPRLVIAADEVAADGLVDIARRGRSAGVHVLLAARRPTDAFAAETRMALRLTDPEDSTAMLGDHAAARIPGSLPGRCYVRAGAGPVRAVQVACVGGPDASVRAAVLPWAELGRPLAFAEPGDTDLASLVAAVREAAGLVGHRAGSLLVDDGGHPVA